MNNAPRDYEIQRRYQEEDESVASLAKRYGLSTGRISQILKERGVTPPRKEIEKVAKNAAKVAAQELLDGGTSMTAAAHRQNVGTRAVREELERKGHDWEQMTADRLAKVRQDRLDGKGTTTCAICGEAKSWGQMRQTTTSGNPTRGRQCRVCLNAISKRHYRNRPMVDPDPTATCTNCGETKTSDEFWRNRKTATGLQSWCKDCYKDWRTP